MTEGEASKKKRRRPLGRKGGKAARYDSRPPTGHGMDIWKTASCSAWDAAAWTRLMRRDGSLHSRSINP